MFAPPISLSDYMGIHMTYDEIRKVASDIDFDSRNFKTLEYLPGVQYDPLLLKDRSGNRILKKTPIDYLNMAQELTRTNAEQLDGGVLRPLSLSENYHAIINDKEAKQESTQYFVWTNSFGIDLGNGNIILIKNPRVDQSNQIEGILKPTTFPSKNGYVKDFLDIPTAETEVYNDKGENNAWFGRVYSKDDFNMFALVCGWVSGDESVRSDGVSLSYWYSRGGIRFGWDKNMSQQKF